MEILVRILYEFTNALLLPVVLCLVALLIWSLFEIGGFLREGLVRRRRMRAWRQHQSAVVRLLDDDASRSAFFASTDQPGLIAEYARRGRAYQGDPGALERLVSDIEAEAAERCARMNLWIRISPMLGLMGTLIPMGPALIGLSSADMGALAGNLVVAFSTTVVGLLIAALHIVMSFWRRQWYLRDLSAIDHLMEPVAVSPRGGDHD